MKFLGWKLEKDIRNDDYDSKQETTSGLFVNSGEIEHGDYDSKDWQELIDDYTKIRLGDPVASTTIELLKLPIMTAEKIITPGDESLEAKEAADFVDWTLDNIEGGFSNYKRHKLLALDFGLILHEKVYKRGEEYKGKSINRLVKLSPIMPETIYDFYFNDNIEWTGIKHEKRVPDSGLEYIDIPKEKLDRITYREEFNDIRGISAYRAIRKSWDLKQRIMTGKATGIQRGAGIVLIGHEGTLDAASASKLQKIGRTISQGKNDYVSYDKSKIEIKLETPKDNQDAIPMLEFLNREIFFNTLTEFITSGIGGNGSRAATSEHKSAYEIVLATLKKWLEANIQEIVDEIVNNSEYANLEPEQKPIFTLSSIKTVDLTQTATQLEKLMSGGLITPTPELKAYINETFNLPETKFKQQVGENIEEDIQEDREGLSQCGCGTNKLSKRAAHECEYNLDKANETLQGVKAEVEIKMENILDKVFNDIAEQLRRNQKKELNLRFEGEMFKAMDTLYDGVYKEGEKDLINEFKKISKKNTELALTPRQRKIKTDRIGRSVKRLFQDIKDTIETVMNRVTPEFIEKKGGLKAYVKSFQEQFKGRKRAIKSEVEAGYIDGRGEVAKEVRKDVALWFYSARLDINLCDNCAPEDGQLMTTEEVIANPTIDFTTPVNQECLGLLGNNNCRCVLIPFEGK
jgi:hypothetical protein